MDDIERVKIAYKKLKASVFFDKTQLPLRDRITSFEVSGIDDKLKEIHDALIMGMNWSEYEKNILDSVGAFVFPKKLKRFGSKTEIFNSENTPIKMDKPQYFIDLSVQGHIISVLWILSIGLELDKNSGEKNPDGMYEHSYGNRLRKKLINPETQDITYSPSLFEPYFSQYESWRDIGLEQAKRRLNDKQDALILTLDFKSFFYSADLRKEDFDRLLKKLESTEKWHCRANNFVFKVISKFSDVLRKAIANEAEMQILDRNILPIGFLPSNILANWVLTPFDNAIIERWNPVYYGRYVDDIIIVDKVEKNSSLYRKARSKNERLSSTNVIEMFLVDSGIFLKKQGDTNQDPNACVFEIKPEILYNNPSSDITVQDEKVKLFYFQSGSTKALLNCFKTKIAQNVSEFRLMPNLDTVLLNQDYTEIFNLKNEDSINKFRGVTGVELDKYSFSKFIGKYRKVCGMINSKEENAFEKDLLQILDEHSLIENYGTWERLFEILVINNRLDLFEKLALRIVEAINRYEVEKCTEKIKSHDGLLRTLRSAVCRTLSLTWGKLASSTVTAICSKVMKLSYESRFDASTLKDFEYSAIEHTRRAYCETRMVNKYVLPLPIDCVLNSIKNTETNEVRLYSLDESRLLIDSSWHDTYKPENCYRYYPYIVTPHELSFALTCTDLNEHVKSINPQDQRKAIEQLFISWNYPLSNQGKKIFSLDKIETEALNRESDKSKLFMTHINKRKLFMTHIECPRSRKCERLRIAVGNARIDEKDFKHRLDNKPNRSYRRYQQFARIFDAAVKEEVELLVLPENYLPFEWLPIVSRMCAQNQIAIVSGLEHVIVQPNTTQTGKRGQVYNLTAIILPYEHDEYKFVNISYHNKVEYSPLEKKQIAGYGYSFQHGDTYQLFCWRDVWFSVYCCFELASIHDRALFQSYSDLTIAVEWNKDVDYFSNIIESLSRDLHCFCIQANSSDYGDSRVISPTATNKKDIIRTKGGRNSCILWDSIDIKALRDFQILEHNLQNDTRSFKQTPPGFNRTIVEMKRDGELFKIIKNEVK